MVDSNGTERRVQNTPMLVTSEWAPVMGTLPKTSHIMHANEQARQQAKSASIILAVDRQSLERMIPSQKLPHPSQAFRCKALESVLNNERWTTDGNYHGCSIMH